MIVDTELYQEAVNKFGKEHQLLVTLGELAECAAEIAKHQIPGHHHDEQDLVDEIADVCIMMGQMEVLYGNDLIQAIHKKLNKLKGYL